jgi:hypothetical protein
MRICANLHTRPSINLYSYQQMGISIDGEEYGRGTILRGEWGFGGTVVSDYQAVQELQGYGRFTGEGVKHRRAFARSL